MDYRKILLLLFYVMVCIKVMWMIMELDFFFWNVCWFIPTKYVLILIFQMDFTSVTIKAEVKFVVLLRGFEFSDVKYPFRFENISYRRIYSMSWESNCGGNVFFPSGVYPMWKGFDIPYNLSSHRFQLDAKKSFSLDVKTPFYTSVDRIGSEV